MSNVKIIKGDLFSAPKGSIICHACNTQGVWGSGIAAQFAKRFPRTFKAYKTVCKLFSPRILGECTLIYSDTGDHLIGCLFTSEGYGKNVDSQEKILENTRKAIQSLIFQNSSPIANKPIYMCKINSGLFGVPWEATQKILEEFPSQTFTVYEL